MNVKDVMKKYDITANGYDELYQEEQGIKYLSAWKIISNMKGKVIDIGCGTLLLERFMSAYGTIERIDYIVGLDISERMLLIGLAKVSSNERINSKLDIVRGDASMLPFRSSSFDFAVSFTVFTLLPIEAIGIIEMDRVARRGGVFTMLKKFCRLPLDRKYETIGETDKDLIFVLKKEINSKGELGEGSDKKIDDDS